MEEGKSSDVPRNVENTWIWISIIALNTVGACHGNHVDT